MSESRELTLAEWCAKLPSFHLVNEELRELREQVEKLTKERDELLRAFNQPVPKSEWEKMQEQLATLAEQNEKLQKVLVEAKSMVGHPDNIAIIDTALSLPNLATPVLNRIKAEAYREAADICEDKTTRWEWPMKTAANTLIAAIRARADELEQSNG